MLLCFRLARRYERGSLQVLNQLKLPHETEYVDVQGASDAFSTIQTMMVSAAAKTDTWRSTPYSSSNTAVAVRLLPDVRILRFGAEY